DKMVERHAAGNQIAPGLARFQADVGLLGQGFDGFYFNERHLAVGTVRFGERPLLEPITVSSKSLARQCLYLLPPLKVFSLPAGDVDGSQVSLEHHDRNLSC